VRTRWLIVLILILPSLSFGAVSGWKRERASLMPKFWTEAEGEPDCSTNPDLIDWGISVGGTLGSWTSCITGEQVIDPGTDKLIGNLMPDPEEFSTVAPVGACRGTNHIWIDTSQTNEKYRAGFCPGGVGSNILVEPYVAKFDQLTDGQGNARTCIAGQDCTQSYPTGDGVRMTVGGTMPVATVTPNLFFTSQARGDVIRRGASTWERVPLGPIRSTLTSNGTDLIAGGAKVLNFNFGCINTTTTGLRYLRSAVLSNACGTANPETINDGTVIKAGRAGTLTALYCETDIPPGAGVTNTYTVRINAVSTPITCPIAGASALTCSLTGQSQAIAAGVKFSVELNITAATAAHDHQCAVEMEVP